MLGNLQCRKSEIRSLNFHQCYVPLLFFLIFFSTFVFYFSLIYCLSSPFATLFFQAMKEINLSPSFCFTSLTVHYRLLISNVSMSWNQEITVNALSQSYAEERGKISRFQKCHTLALLLHASDHVRL